MTPHDQTKLRELADGWKQLGNNGAIDPTCCARELLATLDEMRREELRRELEVTKNNARQARSLASWNEAIAFDDTAREIESELRELEGRR